MDPGGHLARGYRRNIGVPYIYCKSNQHVVLIHPTAVEGCKNKLSFTSLLDFLELTMRILSFHIASNVTSLV